MAPYSLVLVSFALLLQVVTILGQCNSCTRDQGCCMDRMKGQWHCCTGSDVAPWNFRMIMEYDVYTWNCDSWNVNLAAVTTNVSCILDGRWSLERLTFQLTSIPSSHLKSIDGEYTMKDGVKKPIQFEAASHWALTLPVDKNLDPGKWNINDRIGFNYKGDYYNFFFGYAPTQHCPRC